MTKSIIEFHKLDGREVSPAEIQRVIDLAKKDNQTEIIYRLSKALNDNPELELFLIQVKPTGLNAPHHAGIYKDALDNCGRLKPGYKFEKGSVVKVEKKKPAKKTVKTITKPAQAKKAAVKEHEIVKPAEREKKLTKAQFLKLLRSATKKEYDTKHDYIKGYLAQEKQFQGYQEQLSRARDLEKYKDADIIEAAMDKLDKAMHLQVEQGAKYFKLVPVDFISVINLYTEDATEIKKAMWPADKPAAKPVAKPVAKQPRKPVTDKKQLEDINPKPFANKPKSVSIATAIGEVLATGKYPGLNPTQVNVLYSVLKNVEDITKEVEITAGEFQQKLLLSIPERYVYYFDWSNELELQSEGVKLINAIRGRVESLRNQKTNYAMFPLNGKKKGLNAPVVEPVVEPACKPVSKIPQPVPKIAETIEKINKKQPGVLSSQELMNMHFESLKFDGAWADFMQEPAKNMKIAIWGKPKNGKTSGGTAFAAYLTQYGNVLYNFADQGFNKSTQDIWKNAGLDNNSNAFPANARTLEELETLVASGDYQFVFIDMINHYIDQFKLKPHEFKERFINKYPDVSFILIMEVTKSGNFKGDQGWTHIVDALVTVEDFLMENRGRYGVGHYVVWPEGFKKFNPNKYEEIMAEATPEPQPEPAPQGLGAPSTGLKFIPV